MTKIELTLFHAEWCGHCKVFMPEWQKLVEEMNDDGNIVFHSLESKDPSFSDKGTINGESIKGFPTIKIQFDSKEYAYEGERTAEALEKHINELIKGQNGGGKKRKQKRKHITRKKKRVYTMKNYMSGDGMMTSVWGPSMWHMLHTMSFNYPVEPTVSDKKHFSKFTISLQHILPCKYCRLNFIKNLEKMPLTDDYLKNRDSFSRYIYKLHETVNTMLKKKSGLTYCDVRERYENFRARCLDGHKQNGESGCTEPLWGKKAKCVLHIVPKTRRIKTFRMDSACILKKLMNAGNYVPAPL